MNNFQLIQINTNSFYYAIIEKVYYQFQQFKCLFSTNDTKFVDSQISILITISFYENYTQRLFKLDNEEIEMIALISKTYILNINLDKYKTATNGVQKHKLINNIKI